MAPKRPNSPSPARKDKGSASPAGARSAKVQTPARAHPCVASAGTATPRAGWSHRGLQMPPPRAPAPPRVSQTRSSPAPNRPDKGKASPAMARSPSTEQLDGARRAVDRPPRQPPHARVLARAACASSQRAGSTPRGVCTAARPRPIRARALRSRPCLRSPGGGP
eukprot:6178315-Prymnesium_polylepis.1